MNIPGWENSEGRVAGCLPRASKPGEWCPLASERITTIPRGEWEGLIAKPDYTGLRPSVPVVLDQNGVGSCASESATQMIMTTRSFNGQPFELLSPWYVYHPVSGGPDGGSNIDTNCRFLRDNGVAPESVWPRSKGWRAKPSAEADEAAKKFRLLEFYDIQNELEFGSALLQGFVVAYGRRGHAITATDLIDKNTFDYANSWGNWGDKGFGRESLRGINFSYGAWAIRVATDSGESPIVRASEMPPMFEPYPQFTD